MARCGGNALSDAFRLIASRPKTAHRLQDGVRQVKEAENFQSFMATIATG
jgi:hypothetical protein